MKLESAVCRIFLISRILNWTVFEFHWWSCFWRRGKIHCSQPTTLCCCPYILSIDFLIFGIKISSSSWTCLSCLFSRSWIWTMLEFDWRSCFWSRGWIHYGLLTTQSHCSCVLSINILLFGIRIISSSRSWIFGWISWIRIWMIPDFFGEVFRAGAESWQPINYMVLWPCILGMNLLIFGIRIISSSRSSISCWISWI